MKEYKVLKNGKLWSDRFDSEDLAYEHIDECIEIGQGNLYEFIVEEMTEEEINSYYEY